MLDEFTPETPSNHATYQGLQWSVLLQGILEWGWRVGSVVHGVLLIWGYKPAMGQTEEAAQQKDRGDSHFPVMVNVTPPHTHSLLLHWSNGVFLHKSRSGTQKVYSQIKKG